MRIKVLFMCMVLCVLHICRCDLEIKNVTRSQDNSNVTEVSSEDLDEDASVWRLWRPFRRWSIFPMFKKGLTRSLGNKERDHGGWHMHSDQHKRKLKNKIKFLFKIHQIEM